MGSAVNCCSDEVDGGKKKSVKTMLTSHQDKGTPKSILKSKEINPKRREEQKTVDPTDDVEQVSKKINELNLNSHKNKKIKLADFSIEGLLGEGGFGTVYLAQLKQNVQKGIIEKYAIKKVIKQKIVEKRLCENLRLERNILSTFHSNFITSLSYAFQDDRFFYFVMECAIGGDTYSFIRKNYPRVKQYKELGQKAVQFICGCLILGLEYLHKNQILYRDLKPENVLIFQSGYVKLTDFGLAKRTAEEDISHTQAGTIFYYAPQMIMQTGYNKEIDFWTLGIYLYEMSVYEPPFTKSQIVNNKTKIKKIVQDASAHRDWKESNLSPELKDLINSLLKFDPKDRIGVKGGWIELKQHAFFKDFDWKSLEQMKMPSPLKSLVAKYPLKIKPYVPDSDKPDAKSTPQQKLDGWTFVKNEKK